MPFPAGTEFSGRRASSDLIGQYAKNSQLLSQTSPDQRVDPTTKLTVQIPYSTASMLNLQN